jgi:hypothetical protein
MRSAPCRPASGCSAPGSKPVGSILALIALVLEVIFWAISRESGLWFFALVLVTLAVILGGGWPPAIFKRI